MPAEEAQDLRSNVADVSLCAFALTDCIVEIESHSAKYLRAVHRTALELAVPNLFGPHIGGYWLTPTQLEQLRMLAECYPSSESKFVRHAVESYLSAQIDDLRLVGIEHRGNGGGTRSKITRH